MQINKAEYNMLKHIIEELEVLKDVAEREFNNYCANITTCRYCALYKNDCANCNAETYFDLKDKGEI